MGERANNAFFSFFLKMMEECGNASTVLEVSGLVCSNHSISRISTHSEKGCSVSKMWPSTYYLPLLQSTDYPTSQGTACVPCHVSFYGAWIRCEALQISVHRTRWLCPVVISEPVHASPDCCYCCVSSLQSVPSTHFTQAPMSAPSLLVLETLNFRKPLMKQASLYATASEQQRSLEKLCTLPFWLISLYVVTTNLQWALGSALSPTRPPCCFLFLWEDFTPFPPLEAWDPHSLPFPDSQLMTSCLLPRHQETQVSSLAYIFLTPHTQVSAPILMSPFSPLEMEWIIS